MALTIEPGTATCGAVVRGVDLTQPLSPQQVAAIRGAWLEHQVLAFADQPMTLEDLERFALYMGPNGEDPTSPRLRATRTSSRSSARPTSAPGSSPSRGTPTGASCRRHRPGPCCTAR